MTFIILGCALPAEKAWWPLFVILFYMFACLPILIAKRRSPDSSGSDPCSEFALFLTAGIVLSSFALPVVLARSLVITWTACALTLVGNLVIYTTILVNFLRDSDMDGAYGGMF